MTIRSPTFTNKMVDAGVVQADLDINSVYTTEFVCKGVGKELKK